MPRLIEVVREVRGTLLDADGSENVTGVSYDSRSVSQGEIFAAISGFKTNGTSFVGEALAKGAIAILCDRHAEFQSAVPRIVVDNTRVALAQAAWMLAGNPHKSLKLIGVTGTNGKTTITNALAQLLNLCGHPTGVTGTLGMIFDDHKFDSDRTTAEAPDLARVFSSMVQSGATHVAMEATSIGLHLHRLDCLTFEVGVFSNLTRDHLDFHETWENYRQAKGLLFSPEKLAGTGIVNVDDPEAEYFLSLARGRCITYGIQTVADFLASEIDLSTSGSKFRLHAREVVFQVQTSLIGKFNVYNVLAVIAGASALGIPLGEIVSKLPQIRPVRGRAEIVPSTAGFDVIVDYAHTPDALEKILSTIRELTKNRLICVIGAGGDRDRGKRPFMAQVAESYADLIYLTSDNPRTEDPESILRDLMSGIRSASKARVIENRKEAIRGALRSASNHDVVVIAGKGHETYQEIRGVKHPFDDREVVLEWLNENGLGQ